MTKKMRSHRLNTRIQHMIWNFALFLQLSLGIQSLRLTHLATKGFDACSPGPACPSIHIPESSINMTSRKDGTQRGIDDSTSRFIAIFTASNNPDRRARVWKAWHLPGNAKYIFILREHGTAENMQALNPLRSPGSAGPSIYIPEGSINMTLRKEEKYYGDIMGVPYFEGYWDGILTGKTMAGDSGYVLAPSLVRYLLSQGIEDKEVPTYMEDRAIGVGIQQYHALREIPLMSELQVQTAIM